MTITLGWWVLPLIVSLIGFAVSTKFNFESDGSDWFGEYDIHNPMLPVTIAQEALTQVETP